MNRDEKLALVRRLFFRRSKSDLWFTELKKVVDEGSIILEVGSGSGTGKQNTLYPKVNRIVGIDLDDRVLSNPNLDEAHHMGAYEISERFSDAEFDVIWSHMVAEHIDDGELFIRSQLKVLKPGGTILHSTVSKHYWTSMINDYVPEGVKFWLIRSLGSGRAAVDVFPAHYKLNSEAKVKDICNKLGVNYSIIRQDEPPGYLRRSLILMFIYTAVHKPMQAVFPALRPTFIFKVFR